MRRSTLIALSWTALFLAATHARAQDDIEFASHSNNNLGAFRDLNAYRGSNNRDLGFSGCDLRGCDTGGCDQPTCGLGECDSGACNTCGDGCCDHCPGDWCVRFWAESLWLKRHSGSDATQGIISQRDAGPSLGMMWRETECRLIEVSYFQLFDLQGQNAAGTFINDSNLLSAQLNLHRELHNLDTGAWFDASVFTGFRYVRLNEHFNAVGNQLARTYNDLYGGQFGGRIALYPTRRTEIDIVGSAGVFADVASGVRDDTGGGVATGVDHATNVAYVGQISVIGTVRVYENWYIRGGYTFMRLDGVATAQDHFNGGTAPLNTKGTVDYEGGFLGLEVRR